MGPMPGSAAKPDFLGGPALAADQTCSLDVAMIPLPGSAAKPDRPGNSWMQQDQEACTASAAAAAGIPCPAPQQALAAGVGAQVHGAQEHAILEARGHALCLCCGRFARAAHADGPQSASLSASAVLRQSACAGFSFLLPRAAALFLREANALSALSRLWPDTPAAFFARRRNLLAAPD